MFFVTLFENGTLFLIIGGCKIRLTLLVPEGIFVLDCREKHCWLRMQTQKKFFFTGTNRHITN